MNLREKKHDTLLKNMVFQVKIMSRLFLSRFLGGDNLNVGEQAGRGSITEGLRQKKLEEYINLGNANT